MKLTTERKIKMLRINTITRVLHGVKGTVLLEEQRNKLQTVIIDTARECTSRLWLRAVALYATDRKGLDLIEEVI